jgi:hypothetical protein
MLQLEQADTADPVAKLFFGNESVITNPSAMTVDVMLSFVTETTESKTASLGRQFFRSL